MTDLQELQHLHQVTSIAPSRQGLCIADLWRPGRAARTPTQRVGALHAQRLARLPPVMYQHSILGMPHVKGHVLRDFYPASAPYLVARGRARPKMPKGKPKGSERARAGAGAAARHRPQAAAAQQQQRLAQVSRAWQTPSWASSSAAPPWAPSVTAAHTQNTGAPLDHHKPDTRRSTRVYAGYLCGWRVRGRGCRAFGMRVGDQQRRHAGEAGCLGHSRQDASRFQPVLLRTMFMLCCAFKNK